MFRPVDLGACSRRRPRHTGPFRDFVEERFALARVEPLRVVDTANRHVGRQDHRRGEDGAGERAAPDFVDARDPLQSARPVRPLDLEQPVEAPVLRRRRPLAVFGFRLRPCVRPGIECDGTR